MLTHEAGETSRPDGKSAMARFNHYGMSRRIFEVTQAGSRALAETRLVRERLWTAVNLRTLRECVIVQGALAARHVLAAQKGWRRTRPKSCAEAAKPDSG
jgi:hypothetical protein